MGRRPRQIKLFDLFGVRVAVDLSWFLILFLLIYLLSTPFRETMQSSDTVAYITTVVSVLLLFASLIAHELGHALVARRQGIEVKQIELYLFGGLTYMERDVATAGEDFKVSIAGPAATLAVILVFCAIDTAIVGPSRLVHAILLESDVHITPVLMSLSWLVPTNLFLLAFNMVPALPLDGGRIARAAVWRITGSRARGTIVAGRLGQAFGLVLAGVGLWLLVSRQSLAGFWLLGLAWIFYSSARGALARANLDERVSDVCVADIMDRSPVAILDSTPVSQALDEFYDRYRWSWFPVVDAGGRFRGIARQERAQASIDAGEGWLTIGAVLDEDGRDTWRVQEDRPITDLLGTEALSRLGAMMAVDGDGVLRGVVTVEQVRRALQAALAG